MKFKTFISSMAFLSLIAVTAYAQPSNCALGETCPLDKGKTSITITPDDGDSFLCTVTADEVLTFNVKGGGKFKVTEGAGDYEAAPTVDVTLVGTWKTLKPTAKGELAFNKVKGGTGTVICNAVV